ncbi:hypothetical protein NT07LI_1231, partial [Listeria innocua FSL S4-378]
FKKIKKYLKSVNVSRTSHFIHILNIIQKIESNFSTC